MCFAEPRALFDDCVRGLDEAEQLARNAGVSTKGLFTAPRDMDFGSQQRLSFASMLRVGRRSPPSCPFANRASPAATRGFSAASASSWATASPCFRRAGPSAREHLELRFGDEYITFGESLASAAENNACRLQTPRPTSPPARRRCRAAR